jgi:mono/diheme cytochrome c family protein
MKKLFSVLVFCTSMLFAAQTNVKTDLDEEELLELGKEVYEETCISCHGVNGETNPEMELVVKPRKLQKTLLTKDQSFQIIKHGAHYFGAHADIMPTFKYVYSDEQIEAVSLYISKVFNGNREQRVKKLLDESQKLTKEEQAKMLKVGKKIFQKKCALCHGVTGNGESEYVEQSKSEENFIYPYNLTRTLLDEEQIFLYAKFGGHFWGTDKKDMPSWKRKYNDIKLKSVAKYVHDEIKKLQD